MQQIGSGMVYPKHPSVAVWEPCCGDGSALWPRALRVGSNGALCCGSFPSEHRRSLHAAFLRGAEGSPRDSAFKYVCIWGLCASAVHFLRAAGRSLKPWRTRVALVRGVSCVCVDLLFKPTVPNGSMVLRASQWDCTAPVHAVHAVGGPPVPCCHQKVPKQRWEWRRSEVGCFCLTFPSLPVG